MQTFNITKLFQFKDGRFLCLVLPEEPENEDDGFLPGPTGGNSDRGAIYIGREGGNIQVFDIQPMSIMGGGATSFVTTGGILNFCAPHMNMSPRWEKEELTDVSYDIDKYILVRRGDRVIFEKVIDHNF